MTGKHRRCDTTALVRNIPETFIRLEHPNKLSFVPQKLNIFICVNAEFP